MGSEPTEKIVENHPLLRGRRGFQKKLSSMNSGRRKVLRLQKGTLKRRFNVCENLSSLSFIRTSAPPTFTSTTTLSFSTLNSATWMPIGSYPCLRWPRRSEKKGDGKEAFPFYAEALEIYKGDFLPEELYAPWPDKKREELRAKYIELLNKMASLHERQGSLKKAMDCYKKAIQVDPLVEESYQKLMTFYSSKGMYNEALRIYEECKKALKRELKAQPDSTTTTIYNRVLEKIGGPRSTTTKRLQQGES